MSKNKLQDAIRRALYVSSMAGVALALGGVAGAAFAQSTDQTTAPPQDQKPQTLQTIVVTGSHIRRVDLETSNPVVAVTSQQIKQTGKLTLGDIVQSLPVMTGSSENPTINNGGGSGSSLVALRGLGTARTLILVNGQRIINKDLNTIPTSAVERIEVLTDGASAVYGSDAIGGVVNIILKTNYQGAEFGLDYGISDHDDGARRGYHFTFGQTSDKGSIMAGVDYNKFEPILQSSRKFSENAVSYTAAYYGPTYAASFPGTPNISVGGSTFGQYGRAGLSPSLAAQFGCSNVSRNADALGDVANTANYHCFQTTAQNDKYNYASINLLETPQERTNAFLSGTYHLTDNIDAYLTAYHNKTTSAFQLAPALIGSLYGLKISAQSYYNPFHENFNSSTGYDFRARLASVGPRYTQAATTTDQAFFGFKGNFDLGQQNWTWDLGYNFGHIGEVITTENLPNGTMLNQAFGPSFKDPLTGQIECGAPGQVISGCTPADAFNLFQPATVAILKGLASAALTDDYSVERSVHADASGGLFDLPAGTIQLAAGTSYRKEYTRSVVDPVLQTDINGNCTLQSQCAGNLQGGFNVKEAYAELFIPVLKDLPFAKSLNVTLGDRYSKYSDFGSTSNWKVALEYRPIDDLLLRGTVAKVFRAPTVNDIFNSPATSAPQLSSDPCDHITVANPACVGVPLDGSFVNQDVQSGQQIKAIDSGSAYAGFPLGPESGKSFDWGFVYSPHFIPGLSVTADYWRVYLTNVIARIRAQNDLYLCFNGESAFCPLISRFGADSTQPGQIRQVLQPIGNLGRQDTRGVDVSLRYKLPPFSFGQFDMGVDGTYMAQYDIDPSPGLPGDKIIHGAGELGGSGSALNAACPSTAGICLYPRVRGAVYLNWQLGPWDASWRVRYIGRFNFGSYNPSQTYSAITGTPNPVTNQYFVFKYGATVYNDLSVGYTIEPINTHISLGVDNAFNKQPPFLYATAGTNGNTDPNDFDVIGRYYHASVAVKF